MDSEYTLDGSASANARRLIADCKNSRGVLHEQSLLSEVSKLIVQIYKLQGRLPKFIDVGNRRTQ